MSLEVKKLEKKGGKPSFTEPHTLKGFRLADSLVDRMNLYLTENKGKGLPDQASLVRQAIEYFLENKGY